jgi:hypothetical protein
MFVCTKSRLEAERNHHAANDRDRGADDSSEALSVTASTTPVVATKVLTRGQSVGTLPSFRPFVILSRHAGLVSLGFAAGLLAVDRCAPR